MDRIRERLQIAEVPPPTSEKTEECIELLPSSLKDIPRKEKIEALNNAYNNIVRTKKLVQEGIMVYPGTKYAKSDGVSEGMTFGDPYDELKTGLKIMGRLEEAIANFSTENDSQTGQALIRDLHAKIFGRAEQEIGNYNLHKLDDVSKERINQLLGTDRQGNYSDQVVFRPHLSMSEYFYTRLMPLGIVMRETTTHIQHLFPEKKQENLREAEELKSIKICKLPDRPTEAASMIIYKKLIADRSRD